MSIAGIDPTTPASNDNAGLGDDQIRDLKLAIKNCLGGIAGPVNSGTGNPLATESDISDLFDRLDALEASLGATGVFVPGMIMLWSGSIGSIPAGWKLCDGTVYGAVTTPNLEDRFVIGAGNTYAPNATGGAASATSGAGGDHNHGAATGSHSLTLAQLPTALNGAVEVVVATFSQGQDHTSTAHVAGSNGGGWVTGYAAPMKVNGVNGATHNHSISSSGTHTHSVATLPPYYALAYICYVGA